MPDTPDSLDRQPNPNAKQIDGMPQRDAAGAFDPDSHDPDPPTGAERLQKDADDDPVASTVTPADDPENDSADSAPDAV